MQTLWHKKVRDKSGRHVRWAYFREKYHNSRKYAPPLFEEILEFIANGHIFKRLQYIPTGIGGFHGDGKGAITEPICCAVALYKI